MDFNAGKNKKGSTFVEAALVWPFLILAVLAVLTMLMSLFSEGVILSCAHMSLREIAGQWSKTVSFDIDGTPFESKLASKNISERLQLEEKSRMSKSGIPIPREAVEGSFTFHCLYPNLLLRIEKSYGGYGLLEQKIQREMNCSYQSIDEAQLVRNLDYIIEIAEEVKRNENK
ncbi:hypothetical protein [Sinanaerobacter sp. ZZT-01]|uniref:hypothetical protein n=1 Tax=Sinanaerobacter sp. ZZT-01 TaxID=3111540 RepID=UPI002D774B68|nr:hypothetical protein [Sinanaerobacter sp. ZZT-01]WRR92901.1 hypothetical protein U5921_12790 [Sinanaerobacter sp. ZZT-01]